MIHVIGALNLWVVMQDIRKQINCCVPWYPPPAHIYLILQISLDNRHRSSDSESLLEEIINAK